MGYARKASSIFPCCIAVVALFAAQCLLALEDHGSASSKSPPDLPASWAKLLKPKPGTEYVDGMPKEIVWLKDGAEMILVPGGKFLFGENKEEREEPAFYVDKFPVTNERYKKFVDATKYKVPDAPQEWAKPYNWKNGTYPKGKGKHPVVLVDFSDVTEYCRWAEKGLPSDEQWEKAARGTDGRRYPWGEEFEDGRCNSWHEKIEGTTPVDKYPKGASPCGCYDMSGNVWEWTSSAVVAVPQMPSESGQTDSAAAALALSAKPQGYVAKGGSWFDGEVRVRVTSFGWIRPELKGNNLGFRCAVVLPE